MSTFASSRETTEGRIYSVTGGDWEDVAREIGSAKEERVVVNMGPQHPSTHGVLRLMLELEGETITELRCGIGYLHTGIEKNTEYRTWTQGVTFITRMDYLSPLFNETAYCLAVEKLLNITDQVPERASDGSDVLCLPRARASSRYLRDGFWSSYEYGLYPSRWSCPRSTK
jgi:NADH-quinone oxidoreductase subunit D